tara:strand:- start:257 stop:3949 length:3693 start_codon:yes stop_codon:yes gene_type:complete
MAGEFQRLLESDPQKAAEIKAQVKQKTRGKSGLTVYFPITSDKTGNSINLRNSKEASDYDYEDDDDYNEKVTLGKAFRLGLLDTTRGVSQITGLGFDKEEMRREQQQLVKAMQGKNGGLIKAVYFAGAILDPASWLLPFGKAKTLYTMGKYGIVSGAVAGAAGYVDEDMDSIIGEGRITRGEQALLGGIGGGILSPTIGALRNLGVKVTGKGTVTPVGQPDPEGFIGTIFNLKHVNTQKAMKDRSIKKAKLSPEPKVVEGEDFVGGIKEGDKRVFRTKKEDRVVTYRDDAKIGDPSADVLKTIEEQDLLRKTGKTESQINKMERQIAENKQKNFPKKGMYLNPVRGFFDKYIARPYQEKIGRPAFEKIASGQGASVTGGALLGFNYNDELPLISINDPLSSRLGRAMTGAVLGLGGFKALSKIKITRPVGPKGESDVKFTMPITEFLGRGLRDKYNLPNEFIKLRIQAQGLGGTIASQFHDLVQKAKLLNMDERKILYNILEGEEVSKIDSKKIMMLSKEARDVINKYGQMYVDYGLMDVKTFQRNANSYLRRIYSKDKEAPRIGDDLKPRGQILKVTEDDYNKNYKNVKAVHENGQPIMVPGGIGDPKLVNHRGWEIFDEVTEDGVKYKVIRWEYTKAERLAKGEIEDAAAGIELTGSYMASTISQFKFYDDIYKTPSLSAYVKGADGKYKLNDKFKGLSDEAMNKKGYYKMPETGIKDTKVKKYGSLSGKYVLEEVYRNLLTAQKYREMGNNALFRKYRRLNGLWKVSKTAWNPTVHVNNIFGNVFFSDFADVPLFVGTKGEGGLIDSFKMLAKHNSKDPYKSETVYLAQKFGVFDADFIARELKTFDFAAIKSAYKYDANKTEWTNAVDIAGRVYEAVRKNKVTGTLQNWYRLEDHIFRLNAFQHRLKMGDSASDAALFARRQFIDYDIDAPIVNALRHSVTPFLAFSYRIIPLLAETAVVRPWKFAKYAALGYGLNKLGAEMGGGDAEREKQMLPEYSSGNILGMPFMPQKEIKLPFKSEEGQSKYINIQRFFPGGDILDLRGTLPMVPAPLQVSGGIAGDVLFSLLGIDLFRRTYVPPDSIGESLKNVGVKLIPNFPFIPGSYSTKRIDRATLDSNISPYREDEAEWMAILSAFGFKVSNRTVGTLTAAKSLEFTKEMKKLEAKIAKLAERLRAGEISMSTYDKKSAKIIIEMQKKALIFGGRIDGISPADILESPEVLNLRNNK